MEPVSFLCRLLLIHCSTVIFASKRHLSGITAIMKLFNKQLWRIPNHDKIGVNRHTEAYGGNLEPRVTMGGQLCICAAELRPGIEVDTDVYNSTCIFLGLLLLIRY